MLTSACMLLRSAKPINDPFKLPLFPPIGLGSRRCLVRLTAHIFELFPQGIHFLPAALERIFTDLPACLPSSLHVFHEMDVPQSRRPNSLDDHPTTEEVRGNA